ncbi:MAG: GxxExxY protein [Phycisphaerae bacterium]|jgi:GxxExxY protein|nr:GxxExxY protein [Phycisphaerae bacterium]
MGGPSKPGLHADLTEEIIGAAIEVHRVLGPGLLESAYEACLCQELSLRNIRCDRQIELPIQYKGIEIRPAFRMDLVVDNRVVIEVKAVDALDPIHEAQLLTYLRLSQLQVGLLLNFKVPFLRNGVRRLSL